MMYISVDGSGRLKKKLPQANTLLTNKENDKIMYFLRKIVLTTKGKKPKRGPGPTFKERIEGKGTAELGLG